MKKYIYMAVAAIAALSSCSSENDAIMEETVKQPLKFTASMEDFAGTRATFDGENKCASWQTTDYIFINGYQYYAESAGLTTTFIRNLSGQAEGPTFDAYFGCSVYSGQPFIPSSQMWAEGQFNMPMYAHSENAITDLKFKNLCGVLKVTVTDAQIAQVKSIKLSSANKGVSGTFSVDANNAAVLSDADANDPNRTFTIEYTSAVTTDAAGKVFYIPVPAQTYQELDIALYDGTATIKHMTTKAATNITVERNKIYPITFNATSYGAVFKGGDGCNINFNRSTGTASNGDVSVSLALTGDMDPEWDDMGGFIAMRGGTLTITVTPAAGVTVSGITLEGSERPVTKTGSGPWEFTLLDRRYIYDGDTNLGRFSSLTVNYTK